MQSRNLRRIRMVSSRFSRTLAVVCIVALFAVSGLYAGGQGEETDSGRVEIDFLTLFSGGEGDIMADLVDRFNEEQSEVSVTEIPVEWDEYYTRLMTSVLGGDPPQVGVMHLALLPDYVEEGVVAPVDEYIPDGFENEIQDHIIEAATFDDQLYAIPLDTHATVMYYNEDVLREAGLVDGDDNVLVPETWDELLEYSRQIDEETDYNAVGYSDTDATFGERMFIAAYHQLGGQLYNEESQDLQLDSEIAVETYEVIMSIFDEGLAEGPMDYEEANSLFVAGEMGYFFNGVWAMALYPEEIENLGVTQIPLIAGDTPYTWADSHSLVIPDTGDEQTMRAAGAFATWLSENSMAWAEAGHLPVNIEALESQEFIDMPMREDYVGAGENAVLAPQVSGWEEFRSEMHEIGELLILGEYTPEEAVEALQGQIEDRD